MTQVSMPGAGRQGEPALERWTGLPIEEDRIPAWKLDQPIAANVCSQP
jgi:hypothetical protein